MSEHVSSYDPEAKRPEIGSIWVWELANPHGCDLIKVTNVTWNGEEWWVQTDWLHPKLVNTTYPRRPDTVQLNDLSRFWEAVTPVGTAVNV